VLLIEEIVKCEIIFRVPLSLSRFASLLSNKDTLVEA